MRIEIEITPEPADERKVAIAVEGVQERISRGESRGEFKFTTGLSMLRNVTEFTVKWGILA